MANERLKSIAQEIMQIADSMDSEEVSEGEDTLSVPLEKSGGMSPEKKSIVSSFLKRKMGKKGE